jgi:cytosine/adenosine deaminase-related metal-dependent hydrolase
MITWLKNAWILTQDKDRSGIRGHLRIKDGIISEIRPLKAKLPKSEKSVDLKGQALLPGFVQCHVHLCQTLFRNQADDLELMDWLSKKIWPSEAAHNAESLYVSALWGISELLSSGTTTVLDMSTVRHTESVFKAVSDSGIRANIGKCLMDHPEMAPSSLREKRASALREAEDLFLRWNGKAKGRIQASFAPRFAVSCTQELLKEVGALSKKHRAVIHSHVSENRTEIEIVRRIHGTDNLELFHKLGLTGEKLVLAHGIWLTEAEKKIVAQSGTKIVHCPSSNLKLASGIAPIEGLRAQGVCVSLGSDGAPCNNNLGIWNELRLAALLHKPGGGPLTISAQDALDMATREGAFTLGLQDSIGSIEVGKKADLISVDLDALENFVPAYARVFSNNDGRFETDAFVSSLVYSGQPKHVTGTWVDGKKVFDRKSGFAFKKLAWEKLRPQVEKAQITLRGRLQ